MHEMSQTTPGSSFGLFRCSSVCSTAHVEVPVATLADSAEVRDGLLFLLGGGIGRFVYSSFPAQLGRDFAVVLRLTPAETRQAHRLAVVLSDTDGSELGRSTETISVRLYGELDPGEMLFTSHVLSLREFRIPSPGRYNVELSVDGEIRLSHSFRVDGTGKSSS